MQIVLQCFTKRETRTHQKEPLALYKGFCFCLVWVCRTVGKAQNFFFLFAGTSARFNLLFWRLPNHRQVVFYFSDVCRTIGKALFIFFSFAETPARHKFSFWCLPEPRQGSTSFFDTCRSVGKPFHAFLCTSSPSVERYLFINHRSMVR